MRKQWMPYPVGRIYVSKEATGPGIFLEIAKVPKLRLVMHSLFSLLYLLLLVFQLCGVSLPWLGDREGPMSRGIHREGRLPRSIPVIELVQWGWSGCRMYAEANQAARLGEIGWARTPASVELAISRSPRPCILPAQPTRIRRFTVRISPCRTKSWGFDGALLYFASGRQNRIDIVTILMLSILIVLRVVTVYGAFDSVEFCSSMLQPTACYPAEVGVLAICQVLYAFTVVGVCLGMGDSVTFFLQDFGTEYYLFIWILSSMFSWVKLFCYLMFPFGVCLTILLPGQ
jgi:hypothetical protein